MRCPEVRELVAVVESQTDHLQARWLETHHVTMDKPVRLASKGLRLIQLALTARVVHHISTEVRICRCRAHPIGPHRVVDRLVPSKDQSILRTAAR